MLGDKLANGVIRTSTKILMPKMKKSINTTIKQSKRNFEDIEKLSPTFFGSRNGFVEEHFSMDRRREDGFRMI